MGSFMEWADAAADTAGNDFTHPFEYDPGTNSWTTKSATYPDNHVNNMACGVLTDAGTPYIYCVGGSAAGSRPRLLLASSVTTPLPTPSATVAAPWPRGA